MPSMALLGRWLVDPLEEHLAGASTLVIIPDSSLAAVPFSALKREARGRRLIEDLAIVIADGVSPSRSSAPARAGSEGARHRTGVTA
ncbi:MAG: hypothetical protein JWN02_79 [Acidobacteria bacterium]|nr:hypothetical protein [Acidobacteriota bacterium]